MLIDLEQSEKRDSENVAVARVEMLAPFQTAKLREVINSYPNLHEIVWLQEEPRNMGAWSFMGYRLRDWLKIAFRFAISGVRIRPARPKATPASTRRIKTASLLRRFRCASAGFR